MTTSRTTTHTRTEARVRAVVDMVFETLTGARIWGLISRETQVGWHADLTQMLIYGTVSSFEFQFRAAGCPLADRALRFTVQEDGRAVSNSPTGGVDYAQFPAGTKVQLVVRPIQPKWNRHLHRFPSWTSDASFVAGSGTEFAEYSKTGYGVAGSKVGPWDD